MLVVARFVFNLAGGQIWVILQSSGGFFINSNAELYVEVLILSAFDIFGYDRVAKAAI